MQRMNIMIGCESTGTVRNAFRRFGHNVWSCDLLPDQSDSAYHIQDDIRNWLGWGWDMLIVHPPCQYLCSSGLHWNKRIPGRAEETEEALHFVRELMAADIPRICIENPMGCIGTRIDAREYGFRTQKATQYIQPHQFGEDASKRTGLWLKNLPDLKPTELIEPRWVEGKPRWSNQTDSGQNRLGPSENRSLQRSATYPGIARAMAAQWGRLGLIPHTDGGTNESNANDPATWTH